jgi:glyoxylase-like metal-dependent hydrolase (beta-lactamase superfamily II)
MKAAFEERAAFDIMALTNDIGGERQNMIIEKIKSRSTLFRYKLPEWDLVIHLIEGRRNNYVIDTGLGSESVRPVLDYLKGNAKPVVVINTHHHWDHVWGNAAFGSCTVVAHQLCREITEGKWDVMLAKNSRYVRGDTTKQLPDLVFDSEICFPEDNIRLIYTPGHTLDCISVLDEEEGVLNVGDNIGDTMEEIVPELDADKTVYIKTLKALQTLDCDTVVSGHNVVTGIDVFEKILKKL